MTARASLLLALALVLPNPAPAGEKKPTYEVEIVKDVAYTDAKDADPERHKLDLYLPKGAKDYPVFFFIHGGGWRNGSKNGFGEHGKTFASQGIAFVATNYRLSPAVKHPAHAEDVAKAFAWVHANLPKRGANVKHLYVSGHSAGGHLAALLATDERYLKSHKLSIADIKGVLPISGVFTVGGGKGSEIWGEPENAKAASPMTHVKDNLPPFLVFYADKELGALGKQAEEFGKAVAKVKGDITVKMINDRDHGTIMRNVAKPDDEVTTAIVAFIVKHGGLKVKK